MTTQPNETGVRRVRGRTLIGVHALAIAAVVPTRCRAPSRPRSPSRVLCSWPWPRSRPARSWPIG